MSDATAQELADAWRRHDAGGGLAAVAFVDELLQIAARATVVECRVEGGRVVFTDGTAHVEVEAVRGRSSLRSACARLAVVFGASAAEGPSVYGGTATVDGWATQRFHLEFQNNNGQDVFFRLTVTPSAGIAG